MTSHTNSPTPYHSPEVLRTAGRTLSDPNAAPDARVMAASILGGMKAWYRIMRATTSTKS